MRTVVGLLLPFAILVAWQATSGLPGFPIDTLSRPTEIVAALVQAVRDGSLPRATVETLSAAFLGLALGGLVAVPVGFAIGASQRFDRMTNLVMETLRPVPAVAIIPLALLVLGFGIRMEAVVVAFAAFWPIMILARTGMREIDPRLVEVSDALGFGIVDRFRKFLLPGAMRHLFTALNLGLGVALVVAVTVEIVVNPRGLGYELVASQVALKPDRMFAFLVWIAVLGLSLSWLVTTAEGRLFRWDLSERRQA
jgi:ABC-type nitrate/sulfonate/bicarbonate transport system permease component